MVSVGWSKVGRVSCVHRSNGRHLEGACHDGVSQPQLDLSWLLAAHRQQQPLGRRERRDEQGLVRF